MPAALSLPNPGARFGRLVFLGPASSDGGRRMWKMLCDCGQERSAKPGQLSAGKVKSCGCLQAETRAVGGRVKDLKGRVFGRLTVLSLVSKTGGARWACECSCGTRCEATSDTLLSGDKQSCGCLRLERVRLHLAGQRFGRLTAVEPVDATRYGRRWHCRCDCGGEAIVYASHLQDGRVISCGCARLDRPGLLPDRWKAAGAANNGRRRALKAKAGGTFTSAQIAALYKAQRGRCACCGVRLNGRFHRDHRTALANGGTNDITNIELLCGPCNLRKGAKDELSWANENGRLL